MINTPELRAQCAEKLAAASSQVPKMTAFAGLDGFVDEILHVVDKRESVDKYTRLPTIRQWGERIVAAGGKSTNIELVSQMTKLGGNGPIMGNALASFGLQVSYLGTLGYPNLHPVFADFARRAEVASICEPGYTDAVEFEDGKVMLGKHHALRQMNWPNIEARYGRDRLAGKLTSADLVAFVNWTMLPLASDVWEVVLKELCPRLQGRRRVMFFDLADPEKRTAPDITRVLKLIEGFQQHFDVIFGVNEKEAYEVGKVVGLTRKAASPEDLMDYARALHQKVPVQTLVVHPTAYALAVDHDGASAVKGPFIRRPMITTGAGDHFNAGFCLGRMLGLDKSLALLTGVATSGFYVRTAESPSVTNLVGMLNNWPTDEEH